MIEEEEGGGDDDVDVEKDDENGVEAWDASYVCEYDGAKDAAAVFLVSCLLAISFAIWKCTNDPHLDTPRVCST